MVGRVVVGVDKVVEEVVGTHKELPELQSSVEEVEIEYSALVHRYLLNKSAEISQSKYEFQGNKIIIVPCVAKLIK